jgi:hypothetical protein
LAIALIGYPYSAATQDLWLYQQETVTHNAGSTLVEAPVAWNPGSPLYGYRQSLQGISLRKRYVSASAANDPTVLPAQYNYFATFNNPADPANKWAFNNCFPMAFFAASKKHLFTCSHCYAQQPNQVRNTSLKWSGTVFTPNSLNDRLVTFKWMNKSNVITDSFETTQVMAPYNADPGTSLVINTDVSISELEGELSFQPLQVVNFLNLAPGATLWMLDSAMKIVRMRLVKAHVENFFSNLYSEERFVVESMLPDGSATADIFFYQHDSGTILLTEISPPTSAQAGDGVMGLIASHVQVGGYEYLSNVIYGELSAPGYQGSAGTYTKIRDYLADSGYPMRPLAQARRTHTDFVLASQMDHLLREVQDINLP